MEPRRIVLLNTRAPGDIAVLTALVRDIALTYPGQFEIDVDTTSMDIWRHNPYVTRLHTGGRWQRNIEYVKIQYGRGLRDQNHETIHFLAYFHRDFALQCGTKVPLTLPYPDLHLTQEERENRIIEGRYWIVLNGGKSDFTAKVWRSRNMQVVVDRLRHYGLGIVQVGSKEQGHWHLPLRGVLDLVGRTSLRDFMRLIAQADGVICPVTGAMHIAAGFHRPCVVLAGGREAWWWEAYVNENKGFGELASGKMRVPHRYLHTIGRLDCCKHHGCWRNKVVPLHDDKSICLHPVMHPEQPVPQCLDMITPDHVLEAVMSYYTDMTLAPIGENPKPPAPNELPQVSEPPQPEAVRNPPGTASETPAPAARPRLDLFADPPPKPRPPLPPSTSVATRGPDGSHHVKCSVPIPPELAQAMGAARVRTSAKMEGTNKPLVAPAPTAQGTVPLTACRMTNVYDHSAVGGRFTICVLLYGGKEYHDMHKRCLTAIISTVPRDRMDLRIGSNALCPESVAFVEDLVQQGICTKHYRHVQNDLKYPVMREMFHDPARPILTKWVLWFDDDSIADRNPQWLNILAQAIVQHHKADNAHMFGAKFVWTMSNEVRELIRARPWYTGRPFRQQNGQPSPSGNKIIFCTGGFFAITKDAITRCDIPDVSTELGLTHNGGDWIIGEQLYQGGFDTKAFNAQKQFVFTSSVPRRGVTTPVPGETGPRLRKL